MGTKFPFVIIFLKSFSDESVSVLSILRHKSQKTISPEFSSCRCRRAGPLNTYSFLRFLSKLWTVRRFCRFEFPFGDDKNLLGDHFDFFSFITKQNLFIKMVLWIFIKMLEISHCQFDFWFAAND